MNRRVAQHIGRKGNPAPSQPPAPEIQVVESSAARAAARVAARYAKVPSYSEMIAREARATLLGVEAAGAKVPPALPATDQAPTAQGPPVEVAAVEAQAKIESAQPVLAAASSAQASEKAASVAAHERVANPSAGARPVFAPAAQWQPSRLGSAEPALDRKVFDKTNPAPPAKPAMSERPFQIRWDADLPTRDRSLAMARASVGTSIYEVDAGMVPQREPAGHEVFDAPGFDAPGVEMVEPALPIHANLIHFPRELVAAHKARPLRAENPYAAVDQAQLSIFEAEPGVVSARSGAGVVASATGTQGWVGMKLPAIELEEAPPREAAVSPPAVSPITRPSAAEQAEKAEASRPRVAPMNRRILAGIVDFSLIMGAFLTGAIVGTLNATVLPPFREMELGSLVALASIAIFYQALFFSMSRATPGMQYAGLELCTFAGKRPAVGRRCVRAAAMVISLLPLGLGAIWALVDGNQLSWHDRLSSTYLRKA